MEFKTVKRYLHNSLEIQIFNKYEISREEIVRNKETKVEKNFIYNGKGYKRGSLFTDDGKKQNVLLHVILMSTFGDQKPVATYTVDHRDRNPKNNHLDNLCWKSATEQSKNRTLTETTKNDTFIIVKDGVERTAKEWEETEGITHWAIRKRARKNIMGFSYKEYKDLEDEEWKQSSETIMVSNFGRYAIHTEYARKVLYAYELGTNGIYPMVGGNSLHIEVFKAFYPDTYTNELKVCHLDDDPLNANLSNLYLGTTSDNGKDAHANGKHIGKSNEQIDCVGIHKETGERVEFNSIEAAARFLKVKNGSHISKCINNPTKYKSAYKYFWRRGSS